MKEIKSIFSCVRRRGRGYRVSFFVPIAAIFAVMALLLSCESLGSVAQIGAQIGHAAGVVDSNTVALVNKNADNLNKVGAAVGKAFEDITPEQEYYIGRAVAANVLARYKLDTSSPAMLAYVNKICNALVVNSPRPDIFNGYHVNILDTDEINAFATSGGHIFITRGLIGCTTSEDTLAAVLAHEISHIQLQHGLKAIKNSRITQAILVTASAGASAAAGNYNLQDITNVFSDSVSEIINTMVINGYSQSQEFEADSNALKLLTLAGYEPSALLDMLAVLQKNQSAHPGGFNNTHPSPADRIANVQKTIGDYNVTDTRSYRTGRYKSVTN